MLLTIFRLPISSMNEFSKIVIVELKRAGIPIESTQKDQALLYARELRKSKKVNLKTPIGKD